ncbi:unnamed protein product [Anisakis simplex]|uniref:Probable RNA polymerase II nuclear localization protein SLC7A6OS n=1 Tax=Anisakis simplex TaxID=6269 RepID=A0A0M3KEI8_ANISI|nr:unnamed protein product [Anisakis simplex]
MFQEVKDIGGVPHQNANIIDFDAHQINGKQVDDVEMLKCNESDKENSGGDKLTETVADQQQYLSKFCDAIDEGGTSAQSRNSQSNLQFTLNGIPMMSVKTSELPIEADYVFDFYWNPTVVACNPDEMEVRIANANDIELYMGGDEESESNANADDEDDSNDENNWRNDYPDEEEHDSEEHDSDFDDLNEKFDDMDFYGQGVGSSGDEDDDDDDNEKND